MVATVQNLNTIKKCSNYNVNKQLLQLTYNKRRNSIDGYRNLLQTLGGLYMLQ